MVTEQQLGAVGGEAIPTYSTVDKSKKKDKKKDKKAAEQKEMENQYAAVDKTKKKKKKNEVDDTYAEVDMSKKSKKVCWPMIVFAVIFLVTLVVCLYLFCFAILQTALLCPLFLLTSIPLKLKLLQFPPIDSLVFCGFILSQVINFQWLFIAFYMRDLGVVWYIMLLEL